MEGNLFENLCDFDSDLALERRRVSTYVSGVDYKRDVCLGGVWERIKVVSEEGEKSIGRPRGLYDTLTLPAGTYDAVRLQIGAGEGQNWWCVMYPPLCVGAATDRKQATSLWSDNQQELVKNGDRYVVKFKVVEWVQNLLSKFR